MKERQDNMKHFSGKTILNKIAIGPVSIYRKKKISVRREKVTDPLYERNRFELAKSQAKKQLQQLYEKTKEEVGKREAAIFEVHMMMMEDHDYHESIVNMIEKERMSADYAVAVTCDSFSKVFSEMDDEHMKSRADDMKDISERLIHILNDNHTSVASVKESVILISEDLAPSEMVQMDKSKILGLVTGYGSVNSHTSILSRTMDIPALIGIDIKEEWDGKLAILDGYTGLLTIDPDKEYLEKMKGKQEEELRKQELLKTLKGKDTVTLDGKHIKLYANIAGITDSEAARSNDAEGIGLFRSEFLYLESKTFPTESEQLHVYKSVAEKMVGKQVIIRTLDIGADKQIDYFHLDPEENPALGYRALRICLTQQEIFKTQLRAILRASAFGNISVMFPMVISLEEVRKAKEILNECKEELKQQGMEFGEIEVGVMIETPAAVMISDELAKEVDFFSIGTNDLSQYTLALDRQNPKLDPFYQADHPALLKMIQMTIENGHKSGIWVGICGELAADLDLTETFIQMGVDELSVSPAFLLPLREKIRRMNFIK